MSIVIESPNEVYSIENKNNIKLFLAGGITNCPDWQADMIGLLKDLKHLTIYNPRRKDFDINDPNATEQQITWEYNQLRDADIVLFWFSVGSINPIVLYELGMWGNSNARRICVGIESGYTRVQDVEMQTALARPHQRIVYSLVDLAWEVNRHYNQLTNIIKKKNEMLHEID